MLAKSASQGRKISFRNCEVFFCAQNGAAFRKEA